MRVLLIYSQIYTQQQAAFKLQFSKIEPCQDKIIITVSYIPHTYFIKKIMILLSEKSCKVCPPLAKS